MRIGKSLSLWAAVCVLAGVVAQAEHIRVDIEIVPVARLAANLERELKGNPQDADAHVNLARLYAMAYAMNADELPAAQIGEKTYIWFGEYPAPLLPEVKPAKPDRAAAARAYLQRATTYFTRALTLDAGHFRARLGLAWTLERHGKTQEAIAEYRKVVEQGWPAEHDPNPDPLIPRERSYTQEAATRLIPLLDAKKDEAEIATLRERIQHFKPVRRLLTPIAIPLVNAATLRSIVDLDARVPFDADGSGLRRQWTWITDDAGWLVYDAKQQGQITSALQWFGNVTFWLFWKNGYDALAALDDDGDGELSGAELRYLAIWTDRNRDGVSDRGEVRPLSAFDIVGISCRYTPGDGILAAARSDAGVRFKDGRTRPTYDVLIRPSSAVSNPAPDQN